MAEKVPHRLDVAEKARIAESLSAMSAQSYGGGAVMGDAGWEWLLAWQNELIEEAELRVIGRRKPLAEALRLPENT